MTRSDNIEREEDILNMDELREWCGIGIVSLRKLVKLNLIPWYRPVRMNRYFIRGEIRAWLHEHPKYNRKNVDTSIYDYSKNDKRRDARRGKA